MNQHNKYIIARIIGNELYPRDTIGVRLKSLQFILDNEPSYIPKIWILNQIFDSNLKHKLITILDKHQQNYSILNFDSKKYKQAQTKNEKIKEAININKARNVGIDLTKDYQFRFVFDGDCFFTEELWRETINQIESDQKINNRKFYGVPGIRISDCIPTSLTGLKKWEPSLVFRSDADMRFDENIPFAQCDKIELLRRIGYRCEKGEAVPETTQCINVGTLLHIHFGNDQADHDLHYRMQQREISINNLLNQLDKIPIL